MHRAQDTYSLSHLRQHTAEHLERIREGRIETITQNGEAAMVVMSPEVYDRMVLTLERGPAWDEAIDAIGKNEGRDARETIREAGARLGLAL